MSTYVTTSQMGDTTKLERTQGLPMLPHVLRDRAPELQLGTITVVHQRLVKLDVLQVRLVMNDDL